MPTPITPIAAAPAIPDPNQPVDVFDAEYDAFYGWEKNTLAPGANALAQATYDNAVEAAAAAALASGASASAAAMTNFAGDWESLVSPAPLLKGAGVFDQGGFWVLLSDLADATLSRPGVTDDWEALEGYFSAGDLITTARPLGPPHWLETDGAVYAKAAYPVLGDVMTAFDQEITNPPTFLLPAPAQLPAGLGNAAAFSPDGTYLAVAHNNTPFISIYKRSGDTYTKLANPADLPPGSGIAAAFSPDGTYLAVCHFATPFVTIYKREGDVFTKLANPADLPLGGGNGAAFSLDGTYLAVASGASPYVTIYKRAGDVFTKLANPAALPPASGRGAAFSPDGTYLAVAHDASPYVTIYKRAGDVFTKLANPAALPTGAARDAAFSPDGTYLAVAHDTSPYVTVYKRSGDTFTKLANPAALPPGSGRDAAFSPDGTYLAVAHFVTPFVTIYKRSGDTFTKEPDPTSLPVNTVNGLAYFKGTSKLDYLLALAVNATPFIQVYRDAYAYDPRTEFPVPTIAAPAGAPFKTYIRG